MLPGAVIHSFSLLAGGSQRINILGFVSWKACVQLRNSTDVQGESSHRRCRNEQSCVLMNRQSAGFSPKILVCGLLHWSMVDEFRGVCVSFPLLRKQCLTCAGVPVLVRNGFQAWGCRVCASSALSDDKLFSIWLY